MLLPYRFPTWVNGTAALNAQRNTDAEISFEYWDRMTDGGVERATSREGATPRVYNPSPARARVSPARRRLRPASAWARFFEFLYRRYHCGQRASAAASGLRAGQRAEPAAVAAARRRRHRATPFAARPVDDRRRRWRS